VQLNTNGIRLAEDSGFVGELAAAGLSFVFMQFDGTDDAVYRTLRGRDLFHIKEKAIEHCAAHNIGVVLVPTLVPGVNTTEIGAILRYGIAKSPAVRGVHYQPAAFLGRIPHEPEDKDRFTLDELLAELALQSDGVLSSDAIKPSQCDHPLCGFHGDFIVQGGTLRPLSTAAVAPGGNEAPHTAEQSRRFVARRWQRLAPAGGQTAAAGLAVNQIRPVKEADPCCCSSSASAIHSGETLDGFLEQVRAYGFTVTAMAFQDAWNIDLERLRQCSLHVYKDGKFVPFCSYYLGAA
jgi:uncharacterized radical SAM superfamily Fe-S cluster-containing enzyme